MITDREAFDAMDEQAQWAETHRADLRRAGMLNPVPTGKTSPVPDSEREVYSMTPRQMCAYIVVVLLSGGLCVAVLLWIAEQMHGRVPL